MIVILLHSSTSAVFIASTQGASDSYPKLQLKLKLKLPRDGLIKTEASRTAKKKKKGKK